MTFFTLPWPIFLVVTVVCLAVTYLGVLPKGMAGCFLFMMVLGEILGWIGDHTPIIKDFLGGAIILLLASLMLSLLAQFITVSNPEAVKEALEAAQKIAAAIPR